MASQYKLIARLLQTGGATQQVGAGQYGIRMIQIVPHGTACRVSLSDEATASGVAASQPPFAELASNGQDSNTLHFDNAEGRFPVNNGLHVTFVGADSLVYIYGS